MYDFIINRITISYLTKMQNTRCERRSGVQKVLYESAGQLELGWNLPHGLLSPQIIQDQCQVKSGQNLLVNSLQTLQIHTLLSHLEILFFNSPFNSTSASRYWCIKYLISTYLRVYLHRVQKNSKIFWSLSVFNIHWKLNFLRALLEWCSFMNLKLFPSTRHRWHFAHFLRSSTLYKVSQRSALLILNGTPPDVIWLMMCSHWSRLTVYSHCTVLGPGTEPRSMAFKILCRNVHTGTGARTHCPQLY